MSEKILDEKLIIINVGILSFYEALEKQNTSVVQVNWTPPAQIDEEVNTILSKIIK